MNEKTQKFNQDLFRGSQKYFKQNKNTPYKGTPEDKLKILNELDKKYEEALTLNAATEGYKSLLYYAIYGSEYAILLDLSLRALILNKQNKNFDLLLITDEHTLRVIRASEYINEFSWDYFLVDPPEDGVEASKTKTKIYSYPKIWNYNKILYLDADVICRGDFAEIFKTETKGKLEVVQCPATRFVKIPSYKDVYICATLSHSLGFFTENNKNYMLKKNPTAFNAGHFYFENTKQMERHFENVNWLMGVWPSAYFFEQSFMNQYFNLNDLASYNILNKNTTIITVKYGFINYPSRSLTLNPQKEHEENHNLLHFAGSALNSRSKYYFIQHYCDSFKICL